MADAYHSHRKQRSVLEESCLDMDKIKQVLNSPLSRRKSLQAPPKTFGVSLQELASRNPSSSSIPFLVDRLCRFICAKGIDCEGIFRINGSAKTVEKIKETFDKTGDADLDAIDDVMAVAGSLKQFLRDLPDSVIPESMTAQFIQTQEECRQDRAECIKRMRSLLEDLPSVHYQVLKYIARFLIEVARKEALNKMSMSSLGIVFGPNLFRCSGGIERLKDQGVANEIVYKFMLDYEELFGKLDEPMFLTGDSTQDGQPPKHRNSAPARPPPPRLASVDSGSYSSPRSRNSDGGGDDGQQPSPSPRFRATEDDFLERASPFTLADSDGTSTVASPILTAGASEVVAKTISNTVSELLFYPIKSAAAAGATSRDSTSISPAAIENVDKGSLAKPSRRTYNQPSLDSSASGAHDSMDSDSGSQASSEPVNSPKAPVSKPRAGRSAAATAKAAASASGSSSSSNIAAVTASSTMLSNVDSAGSIITHVNEAAGLLSDLDAVVRQDTVLAAVRRPKGPSNRKRPTAMHSLGEPPSAEEAKKEENNNELVVGADKRRDRLPSALNPEIASSAGGSGSQKDVSTEQASRGSGWPTTVPAVVLSATVAAAAASAPPPGVPPLDLGSLTGTKAASGDDSSRSIAASAAQLPVQRQPTANAVVSGIKAEGGPRYKDEQQESSKQLNKRIKDLKATIAEFEASYEVEHGLKPSYQDKSAHPSIKKAMSELTKARKEAKGLETQLQEGLGGSLESLDSADASPSSAGGGGGGSSSSHDDNNRLNRMPPEAAAATSNGRNRKPLVAARPGGHATAGDSQQPATKEPTSMRHTLDLLLRRLRDKRVEGGRPEELGQMTREQVQDEKLCVQKALLHFEGYHGRPSSKADKELMKPLYDRYRQIKKIITASSWSTAQQGSTLGESMDMDATHQLLHPKKAANNRAPQLTSAGDPPVPADISSHSKEHASLQSMSSQDLLKEQSKTLAEKRKLHQVLRTFEDNFINEHGRAVQKEDRVHMKSQYREYKYIKSKIRLIEHLLAKHGPTGSAAGSS